VNASEEEEEDGVALDPGFAARFEPAQRPPAQLYLISPLDVGGDFPARLEAALSGGPVAAFQFRVKGLGQHEAAALAAPLQSICEAHEVAFIVNDDMALAQRLGADGVHLGQGDGDPREARQLLGPTAQIGVTVHDSRHLAMEAGEAGADYVAFGAFFPTATKEVLHRPDPSILSWWSRLFEIPCVAIGGITPGNGGVLVEAGADFLAVCGAVWNHPEGPAVAVAAFQEVLSSS
jgi:thiamine-phosphate pyrophosphorylase